MTTLERSADKKESSVDSENQPIHNANPVTSNNFPMAFPTVREVKSFRQIDEPGIWLKVSVMTKIATPDEEILVRSLHPSLRDCEHVSVIELSQVSTPLWLISACNAKYIKHTHAGGREIHVLPKYFLPPVTYISMPVCYMDMRIVDPQSFLNPKQIKSIQNAFPGSISAQVLLTGWLLVVFADKNAMKACWKEGALNEVGGLWVSYTLAPYQCTAGTIESAGAVNDKSGTLDQQAALGL